MTKSAHGQARAADDYFLSHFPLAEAGEFSEEDIHEFIDALRKSKQELDIARQQFESVNDPRLIDHVVFRLGAAERHFSYLLQLARQLGLNTGGIRWDWYDKN